MPYDNPDATDPMALHGVAVETEDDTAMREMAECFVEEYLRCGFDADRVFEMFRTPAYAGPFLACKTLGEGAIAKIIDGQLAIRNQHRPSGDAAARGLKPAARDCSDAPRGLKPTARGFG